MNTSAPAYNHAVPYKDHLLHSLEVGLEATTVNDSGSDHDGNYATDGSESGSDHGDFDSDDGESGSEKEEGNGGLPECPPFDPAGCLFCRQRSADLSASLQHMRLAHGFMIPDECNLAVDTETLVAYLHLVIFGYHECLLCGSARPSRQAAQQHMTGKNHCRFDLSSEESEYRDFYEWEHDSDAAAKPVVLKDAMRLPSGKILAHRDHAKPSRVIDPAAARKKPDALPASLGRAEMYPSTPAALALSEEDKEGMSKRMVKRCDVAVKQMAHMSVSDRLTLQRYPVKQQWAMILQSRRNVERAWREREDLKIKMQIKNRNVAR